MEPLPDYPTKRNGFSQAEERRLIAEAQAGSKAARDTLVMGNEAMTKFWADRYTKTMPELFDDGCSIAMLGLLEGVDRYDLSDPRKVRLVSYATWWVKRYLRDWRAADHMIRVPPVRQRSLRAAEESDAMLTPHNADAARALAMASLDAPIQGDFGNPTTLKNFLTCETVERAEAEITLREALEHIDGRDRAVLEMRFLQRMTLDAVSAVIGVTRERVRQIEKRALVRARDYLLTKNKDFSNQRRRKRQWDLTSV